LIVVFDSSLYRQDPAFHEQKLCSKGEKHLKIRLGRTFVHKGGLGRHWGLIDNILKLMVITVESSLFLVKGVALPGQT